jgi:hypothetical protein
MNQEDLRSRLLIEVDFVTVDALSVAQGLEDPQLHWRPGEAWSIGQILEHLVVTSDLYVARVRGKVYSPHAAHVMQGNSRWEPSLVGWMLVKGLRSKKRLRSPAVFRPGPAPRPDIVEAFLQRQRTLTQLLRAASALEWNRVRTASPASRLIRLNLGDVFNVLIVHAQRHVKQMSRVREAPEFPS